MLWGEKRFQGLILGSGSAKQTWTTGEQQVHIHIHHKTSTILYIDIWTSSPGRKSKGQGVKTSVSTLRRDQDSRVMAKRGGMEWMKEGGGGYEQPLEMIMAGLVL